MEKAIRKIEVVIDGGGFEKKEGGFSSRVFRWTVGQQIGENGKNGTIEAFKMPYQGINWVQIWISKPETSTLVELWKEYINQPVTIEYDV